MTSKNRKVRDFPVGGIRRKHSQSLQEAAAELGKSVDDVTPIDLLAYQKEDLRDGKRSPLGGEVKNSPLNVRMESETRRLAKIGREAVDAAVARADKRAAQ